MSATAFLISVSMAAEFARVLAFDAFAELAALAGLAELLLFAAGGHAIKNDAIVSIAKHKNLRISFFPLKERMLGVEQNKPAAASVWQLASSLLGELLYREEEVLFDLTPRVGQQVITH